MIKFLKIYVFKVYHCKENTQTSIVITLYMFCFCFILHIYNIVSGKPLTDEEFWEASKLKGKTRNLLFFLFSQNSCIFIGIH